MSLPFLTILVQRVATMFLFFYTKEKKRNTERLLVCGYRCHSGCEYKEFRMRQKLRENAFTAGCFLSPLEIHKKMKELYVCVSSSHWYSVSVQVFLHDDEGSASTTTQYFWSNRVLHGSVVFLKIPREKRKNSFKADRV